MRSKTNQAVTKFWCVLVHSAICLFILLPTEPEFGRRSAEIKILLAEMKDHTQKSKKCAKNTSENQTVGLEQLRAELGQLNSELGTAQSG